MDTQEPQLLELFKAMELDVAASSEDPGLEDFGLTDGDGTTNKD